MGGLLDRVDALSARHARVIGWLGTAWFALSCAAAAGFVRLPVLLAIEPAVMIGLSVLFNIAWWGFGYPRAVQRRARRSAGGAAHG